MKYESSNPMFFGMKESNEYVQSHMTVEGTSQKAVLLLVIAIASAVFSVSNESIFSFVGTFTIPIVLALLAVSVVTAFAPKIAFVTAPIYAIISGSFLGVISMMYEFYLPGIIIQALLLTSGLFITMFILYSNRVLRVTPAFTKVVVAATAGIMLTYLVSIAGYYFGFSVPFIHENGVIGIGFSLFVVGIACLNLILDFNFIEKSSQKKLAKYFEWFGAFALLVTIVWLYIEVLRLLAKLRSR